MEQHASDLVRATAWYQEAKPGDRFVYHTGNLAADRYIDVKRTPKDEREQRLSLDKAADFLWDKSGMVQYKVKGQYEECPTFEPGRSRVHLLQMRVEADVYHYVAVRR